MEALLGRDAVLTDSSQSRFTQNQSQAAGREAENHPVPHKASIEPAKMSMRSFVGLNKQLPSQAYARVLASGVRGFHAGMSLYYLRTLANTRPARPTAVSASKPRAFGGDRIYPSSGCMLMKEVRD